MGSSRRYFWPGVAGVAAIELCLLILPFRVSLFGLGVSLTSFLAAYLIATLRPTTEVESVVAKRTAELAEANRRLGEGTKIIFSLPIGKVS